MLTVNLPPEKENQIRQNAAERGQDTARYVNDLIVMALRQPVPPMIQPAQSAEEFVRWWREWTSSRPIATQTYPETTFRREDIYDDDGR